MYVLSININLQKENEYKKICQESGSMKSKLWKVIKREMDAIFQIDTFTRSTRITNQLQTFYSTCLQCMRGRSVDLVLLIKKRCIFQVHSQFQAHLYHYEMQSRLCTLFKMRKIHFLFDELNHLHFMSCNNPFEQKNEGNEFTQHGYIY